MDLHCFAHVNDNSFTLEYMSQTLTVHVEKLKIQILNFLTAIKTVQYHGKYQWKHDDFHQLLCVLGYDCRLHIKIIDQYQNVRCIKHDNEMFEYHHDSLNLSEQIMKNQIMYLENINIRIGSLTMREMEDIRFKISAITRILLT